MLELHLTRVPGERRLYNLDGIGTLRLSGLLTRSATAQADAETWQFARSGFWQRNVEATDAAGAVAGTFRPREIRRGGRLDWRGREYALSPDSTFRERYWLTDGDRRIARLESTGWWGWGARQPVRLELEDPGGADPGLLLFASFVVRALADDAAATASSGSTAATMSSGS
jgi:hypothetical protein